MEEKRYLNRDLSWLEFNCRVLREAQDEGVPLLERVKFLAFLAQPG
jgi:polyphosphate kinase